jgi:hypothetical protein
MNNRREFLSGAGILAGLALSGCEKLQQSSEAARILASQGKGGKRFPDYRYRLTVEVETPEGLKSGSSVIEVKTALGGPNDIPSPGSLFTEARGEAVAVDLGERGVLFALLRSEQNEEWAARALLSVVPQLTRQELAALRDDQSDIEPRIKSLLKLPLDEKIPLPRYVQWGVADAPTSGPPNGYPMLVRFGDLTKPETVKHVDPDKLSKTFGSDVRLASVTVALTNDPVTVGIQKQLPWLKAVGQQRSTLIPNPPRFRKDASDPLMQYLGTLEFSTEIFE